MLATLESNKSAPIPATSPTLSPTLSAMTAGFLGSSSGIPSSTLPTRSALMSAVLVKMPPPAFANKASELAPKLNPRMAVASPAIMKTAVTPSKLVPTTAMPMTAPPRKPARKANLMPVCDAAAALRLAMVATWMPTLPARAEKVAPMRNETAMTIFCIEPFQIGVGMKRRMRMAMTPAKRESIEYSRFRNVLAPCWMYAPMSSSFLLPAG